MALSVDDLPNDIETLKALLVAAHAATDAADARAAALATEVDRLTERAERLVANLKASDKLFADETRCPVLDPGRGRTKTGYL